MPVSELQRKADTGSIRRCPILGVNIAEVNMPTLVEFVQMQLPALSGEYMCVANVHTTVTASEDESFRQVQNNAVLAIPDGGPLASEGRKRGFTAMERTTGPSFMGEIFALSAQNGYRHYFYGSTPETLEKLSEILPQTYPGIAIAGIYSPPFRALDEQEDEEITRRINEADADFVWVGLGAPKQEKWMAAHQGKIKGFMVGVGAGFDYYAGNIQRAPEWMQKNNLEWVYRLIQDPKRLFARYLKTNTKFIVNAVWRKK